ncbi:M56 family metallopeptidase [Paludisphaera sp.]|uniref:M56 family metallopeptidase n=1 Tax=Paludisphaera sp. TaxID=2017432 RepID=UPI00301B7CE0
MLDAATPSPQGLIDLAWLMLPHSAWLGLVAGSLASLAVALGRPATPRARHALIVAALVAVATLAPAAALAQRWSHQQGIAPATVRATIGAAPAAASGSARKLTAKPVTAPRASTAAGRAARLRGMIAGAAAGLGATRPYLLAGWAVGVLAYGAMLVVGALSLRRLGREAVPCPALDRRARALGRALRLRRTPATRVHPRIVEPCLTGGLRPLVLLPSRWLATAPAAEVDAVLAHELAHARRLDHRANALLRAIEAAFWFHPGVRRASRLARREAERAADALAVRLTGDALSLARALESVARSLPSRPRSARAGLAVGGDRSALIPRIQELLGMEPSRPRFPFRALAALPVAAVIASVAASTAPAQGLIGASGAGGSLVAPPPADEASEAAQAAWLARVHELRGKIKEPESDRYAMSALFRLVPGNPRRAANVTPPELPIEQLTEEDVIRLASTRPARLSREDLVTLVRTIPHGLGDSAKLSREELLRLADPHQVSFEVRFLQARHDPELVPPAPLGDQAQAAQPLPAAVLQKLVEDFVGDSPGSALQAPKVTTFEGASALIFTGGEPLDEETERALTTAGDREGDQPRVVARLDGALPGPEDLQGLVVTDQLHGALRVQLTAIRKPWGHAIEARTLATVHDGAAGAEAAPKAFGRLARVNVPDGFSILLDSGVDAIGADDDPSGPSLRTLIAITPRHILSEEEEEAVNGPVEGFASREPSAP